MLLDEYEHLAGYHVDPATYYNILEPMYLAIPETVTKQRFVEMMNPKVFDIANRSDIPYDPEGRPCEECIWHTINGCSVWDCDPITRREAHELLRR